MNLTHARALETMGRNQLRDEIEQFAFDTKYRSQSFPEDPTWRSLRLRARKEKPEARWFRRVVVALFDAGPFPVYEPLVLGFETLPSLDEFLVEVNNAAERLQQHGVPLFVFDADLDMLIELERFAHRAADARGEALLARAGM